MKQAICIKLTRFFGLSFLIAICSIIIFSACRSKNPYDVDLKGVSAIPVELRRYEALLFEGNPYELPKRVEENKERFAVFLEADLNNPLLLQQLFDYVSDPMLKEVYLDVKAKYQDVKWLENDLEEAFRYYRYYYPDVKQPLFYSYISGLDYEYPVKKADDNIIIGLDMYLGSDYKNYPKVGVPAYKSVKMIPENIVPDVMRVMAEQHTKNLPVPKTFLDNMIYAGKILYFLDVTMPHASDTIKMNYTQSQLEWCEKNEGQVWAYFIENQMLYSTDRLMINKFLGDAPFTSPFSADSPSRVANWVGWQIVRQFMERNPKVGLQQMLDEQDSQLLLSRSGYKPKK